MPDEEQIEDEEIRRLVALHAARARANRPPDPAIRAREQFLEEAARRLVEGMLRWRHR